MGIFNNNCLFYLAFIGMIIICRICPSPGQAPLSFSLLGEFKVSITASWMMLVASHSYIQQVLCLFPIKILYATNSPLSDSACWYSLSLDAGSPRGLSMWIGYKLLSASLTFTLKLLLWESLMISSYHFLSNLMYFASFNGGNRSELIFPSTNIHVYEAWPSLNRFFLFFFLPFISYLLSLLVSKENKSALNNSVLSSWYIHVSTILLDLLSNETDPIT